MPEQPKIIIQGQDATGGAINSAIGNLKRLGAFARSISAQGAAGARSWHGALSMLGRIAGLALFPLRLLGGGVGALSGLFSVLWGIISRVFGALVSLAGAAVGVLGGLLRQVMGVAEAIGGALWGAVQRVFGFLATGAKAGVLGLVAALGLLARRGVGVNLELGGVERGLAIMLKGKEAARSLVASMRSYAENSVAAFRDIAGWGRSLIAFGFAGGLVIPMLRTLGDTAAGLNLDSGGMQRLILAMGQMRAKGKVSGEESAQLMEAGIPVRRYLGVPEGMDIAQMKIPAMEGIRRILAGMRADFGGMQAGAMKTLPGIWSNIGDAVDRVSAKVTTGLLSGLTRAADTVLQFLSNLEQTAAGQTILSGLSALFTTIGNSVAGLAARLPQLAQLVAKAFQNGAVSAWWSRMVDGAKRGLGWLIAFAGWVRANWASIWQFAKNTWDWFVGVLKGGLEWFRSNWQAAWNGASALLTTSVRVMLAVWAGLNAAFEGTHVNLQGFIGALRDLGLSAVPILASLARIVFSLATGFGAALLAAGGIVSAVGLLRGNRRIYNSGVDIARGGDLVARQAGAGQAQVNQFETAALRMLQGANIQLALGDRGFLGRVFSAMQASWAGTAGMGALPMLGVRMPALPQLTPLPGAPAMPGWSAPVPVTPQAAPAPPAVTYVPSRQPSPEALAEDEARWRRHSGQGAPSAGVQSNADAAAQIIAGLQAALDGARRLPDSMRGTVRSELGRLQDAVLG